jgi:drug/metabolite transporter (DMT)-like permease
VTLVGLFGLLFSDFFKKGPEFKIFLNNKGVQFGLLGSILFALSFPFDKKAVISSSALFMSVVVFIIVGLVTLVINLVVNNKLKGEFGVTLRNNKYALLLLLVSLGMGSIFTNQALNYSIVAYASSLKRLQAVWTILLAGAFLKEKNIKIRLLSTVVMLFGIVITVI